MKRLAINLPTEPIKKSKNTICSTQTNHDITNEEADTIYQKLFTQNQSRDTSASIKNLWTEEEIKLLSWAINKYCFEAGILKSTIGAKDWEKISMIVPGRNTAQCRYKWSTIKKHDGTKMPWGVEEDNSLTEIISIRGIASWKLIAKELNERIKVSRSGKQCRERWLNHLNPIIAKYVNKKRPVDSSRRHSTTGSSKEMRK